MQFTTLFHYFLQRYAPFENVWLFTFLLCITFIATWSDFHITVVKVEVVSCFDLITWKRTFGHMCVHIYIYIYIYMTKYLVINIYIYYIHPITGPDCIYFSASNSDTISFQIQTSLKNLATNCLGICCMRVIDWTLLWLEWKLTLLITIGSLNKWSPGAGWLDFGKGFFFLAWDMATFISESLC